MRHGRQPGMQKAGIPPRIKGWQVFVFGMVCIMQKCGGHPFLTRKMLPSTIWFTQMIMFPLEGGLLKMAMRLLPPSGFWCMLYSITGAHIMRSRW